MTILMPANSRAVALINLTNLKHNFNRVRELAPNSAVLAMVKADAYGHGIIKVVQTLSDADAFGVHCLQEAVSLRKDGINKRIVLMVGFIHESELTSIVEQQLDIVLHNHFQLNYLLQNRLPRAINVWLKIDTGMRRLGFTLSEAADIYQRLSHSVNVNELRIMTHFAYADDHDQRRTNQQINLLDAVNIRAEKSLANSAAIFEYQRAHADWVRPGIMLYGASPFADKTGVDLGLRPVMTLKSRLVAIHEFQAGDYVGYGGNWCCPESMKVGTASIGYGDGYPRNMKNGAPVIVNDRRCQVVGRVSMDMITIDLRACPHAQVGDEVELWGDNLPAEIVAGFADTISYELFCRANKRVEFIYC